MSGPLLIGTRGWLHPTWDAEFYPPELPPEWRFCFYSNRLRAVLVPREVWPGVTRSDVVQWEQDGDPGFRFVLEAPTDIWAEPATAAARFFDTVAPIAAQVAGLSLAVPASTRPAALDQLLALLTPAYPVCLAVPAASTFSSELGEIARRYHAGREWHVDDQEAPVAGGRFLVARMRAGDPRALRVAIDALVAWRGDKGTAGLFFDAPEAHAPRLAEQARTLAELMGV